MSATPVPAPPAKVRPSAWWFVLGGALVVAAIPVFIVFLIRSIDGFADIEARVPGDGTAHPVVVTPNEEKFLWVSEAGVTECQLLDEGPDAAVTIRPVSATYTRSTWTAAGRFDSGTGRLTVTCSGGPAEIGPAVDVASFVINMLLAVGLPLLLGGAGLAVVVVTGVLWAVRPARRS